MKRLILPILLLMIQPYYAYRGGWTGLLVIPICLIAGLIIADRESLKR